MNPNKALWEKGDFTRLAETMRQSGEELASKLNVRKEYYVLDLGCGDGTTALPIATQAANVLGVDIARNLVDAGNRRAKEAGLSNCFFREGDACDLRPIQDNSFDLTVSIFGAMFAPNPYDVAREMVRVTKPGGQIVMGNWIPGDPTLVAQILKISSAYAPAPPQGFISPMTWGVIENVVDRFTKAGVSTDKINCLNDTFTFRFAGSPSEFVTLFRNFYGPTMNAFDAAASQAKSEQLFQELVQLFTNQNKSDTNGQTIIPATYLRVTVKK